MTSDSVRDAIEDISSEDLVRPQKPAKKTVYFNEWRGDDKNNGLASDRPVLTRKRGLEVARMERTQAFSITGSAAYVEKITKGKMKE
jgi:hypothetical protein